MQLQSARSARTWPFATRANGVEPVEQQRLPSVQSSFPASLPRLYMTGDLRAATGLSRTHLDYYLRGRAHSPLSTHGKWLPALR